MGNKASSAEGDVESQTSSSFSRFLGGDGDNSSSSGELGGSSWISMPFQSGGQAEEDPCTYFSLTRQQRLYGFMVCFAMGCIMSLMSSFFVGAIVLKPSKFAVPYTMGSLCSLGSSTFLVGPAKLCRQMCAPIRVGASIVYIVSLIGTLFCAFWLKNGFLTLVMVVIQFTAYAWFAASFIPFGRSILTKCCSSIVGV